MSHVSMMRFALVLWALKMKASSTGKIASCVISSKKELSENELDTNKKMKMTKIDLAKVFLIISIAFISVNCSKPNQEVVIIKDAHLYVPLKGSMMTSGYLSISNSSKKSIEIIGIDCTPIRAEIHETKMNAEGMMRMSKINSFILEADTSDIFMPGGKHVMFWGLNDFKEEYLNCYFEMTTEDRVQFKFSVQKRG